MARRPAAAPGRGAPSAVTGNPAERTIPRRPARLYPARATPRAFMTATIDEIIDNFALLDEWDDRYRYVIELGRTLAPLPEELRTETNKVQGCASQVWLGTKIQP